MHSSGDNYSLSDIANKLNELSSITFNLENNVNELKTQLISSRTMDSTAEPKVNSYRNQGLSRTEIEKIEPISDQKI